MATAQAENVPLNEFIESLNEDFFDFDADIEEIVGDVEKEVSFYL